MRTNRICKPVGKKIRHRPFDFSFSGIGCGFRFNPLTQEQDMDLLNRRMEQER